MEGRRVGMALLSWTGAVMFGLLLAVPAGAGQAPPPVMRQVAPDLYFDFDETASNSIIWVTGEGVLRPLPRVGAT